MMGDESGGDHAARASGGLPRSFDNAPWMRSSWVARHRHCAQRTRDLKVKEKHNAVPGTPRRDADVGDWLGGGALLTGPARASGGLNTKDPEGG